MTPRSPEDLMAELQHFDTPSITNAVATYPGARTCLSLYDPWAADWYTDQSIRCMFPELGPRVGRAVTCVYGLPGGGPAGFTFADVVDALEAAGRPTILVLEQRFPARIAGKVGLAGGNMVSAMKAVGCVGLVSNGPSRDVDEVRPLDFQYLLSGVTAGHGEMAVLAVNTPVSVAGMDVNAGEIIHMDENGAVKFPADRLEAVLANVRALRDEEEARMGALRRAGSAAEVRAILGGQVYVKHPRP
jgi:4-hydroxy-4-methyl-2-oxoglutarate aldolase